MVMSPVILSGNGKTRFPKPANSGAFITAVNSVVSSTSMETTPGSALPEPALPGVR